MKNYIPILFLLAFCIYITNLSAATITVTSDNIKKNESIVTIGTLETLSYMQMDTAEVVKIDFNKIHKCNDIVAQIHPYENNSDVNVIIIATEIEGADKDLFHYEASKELPSDLLKNDILIFSVIFNPAGTTNGTKVACFYVITDDGTKQTLQKFELTAEVVKDIKATPDILDFGNIEPDQIYKQNIKLENYVTKPIKIKTGYLVKNTDFYLETNLNSTEIIDNIVAVISVNSNTIDKITDTLIIITEYKNCDDTLIIPIKANVYTEPIDTIWYASIDTVVHLCSGWTGDFSIKNNDPNPLHISTITMDGPDKNMFSYTGISPLDLNYNDYITIYITFNPTGANVEEEKVVYFYVDVIKDYKQIVWKIECKIATSYWGITTTPYPLDFGNLEPNQTYIKNIKLEGQDTITNGYLVKNIDFNLETNLNNAIIFDSLLAIVSVNSDIIGEITDTLIIVVKHKYCDDTLHIPIKANLIDDVKFTIRVNENKNISPTIENYDIPVYITSNADIFNQSLYIKQLIFTINKNLFYPKSLSNGDPSYFYDEDTISIKVENILIPPIKKDVETLLLNINGDILLAGIDSSVINIIEPIIEFTTLEPILISGCITLTICDSGEDRFLIYTPESPGIFVLENPVSNLLKLKCICYERGSYYFEIFNAIGNALAIQQWNVNPNLLQTNFFFDYDIPHFLDNGTYHLIMHGPTKKYYNSFVIVK